jgi:hypothetical protein
MNSRRKEQKKRTKERKKEREALEARLKQQAATAEFMRLERVEVEKHQLMLKQIELGKIVAQGPQPRLDQPVANNRAHPLSWDSDGYLVGPGYLNMTFDEKMDCKQAEFYLNFNPSSKKSVYVGKPQFFWLNEKIYAYAVHSSTGMVTVLGKRDYATLTPDELKQSHIEVDSPDELARPKAITEEST